MNAATILQSDVLDIIFENRNKQYGAYSLRREYNSRLYRSLALVMGIVLVLVAGNYISANNGPGSKWAAGALGKDTIELTRVEIPKEPLPPPPPPAPPTAPAHTAAVRDVIPVIVPDNVKPDTLPTAEQLQTNAISTQTTPGDPSPNDNPPGATGPGKPGGTGTAPAAAPVPDEPAIAEHPDVMPEFPGGMAALLRFLGRNLQVPEEGVAAGERVRVPVKFVVNREGQLTDVEFVAQTGEVFKKEILRVIKKMPRWKPGLQHGKAVAVYYTIPIIFEMTDN